MLRVGLTGGIACGKSQVLLRLEAGGCFTLDLDRVAHEVMAPGGAAHADVVAAFGPAVVGPDGAVDRKALAAIVFHDAAARERLNAIVHPRVRGEEQRRTAALAGDAAAVVVVDAALLVEAGLHLRFDRLVVVHCSPEQQLQRLMARDSLSRDAAAARIRAQMPVAEKRRFAHFEVDTTGRPQDTGAAADTLAGTLRALARTPVRPILPAPAVLAGLLTEVSLRILEDIASAGGLEMPRVAALVGRPPGGSWLAALEEPSALGPSAIVVPGVAWSLARRGDDDELLGLAALSLARVVTADAVRIADACAMAWQMARFASGHGRPDDESQAAAFARRWSGAAPRRKPPGPLASREPQAGTLAAADRFLAAARGWSAA